MENEIKYEIEIKGVSSLLMNRFRGNELSETKVRRGEVKEADIEDKLYLTEENKPYIPSAYFRNAFISGGSAVKIKGKGKSTYSKLIGSSILISPDMIIIEGNKYKAFETTAVNPMTRGRMKVIRPMFENWICKFSLIAPDDIPEADLSKILDEAGRYVGIGDWRPAKKGMYGKFIITKFKKVDY